MPVRHLSRTFAAGLLAALPLAATVVILVWLLRTLYAWVGPGSLVGRGLVALGVGATGLEVAGYLVGVLILVLAIYALGLLVRTGLRPVLAAGVNAVIGRIPLVGPLYDLSKKLVGLVGQRDAQGVRSMSPVWLHFGGPGGAAVLGLLSTPEPVRLGDQAYLAVLVPTAPVPVGGGLLYVPEGWVTPADVGIDGLTSIYVSMGITTPQHLGRPQGDGAEAR